jgi:hypothetical protein
MFDPRAYLRRYLNITWPYEGRSDSVRVDQYLNAKGGRYRDQSVKAWEALWNAAPDDIRREKAKGKPKFKSRFTVEGAPYTFDDSGIWCAFRGKASPDTIAATCWLAMHWGLVTPKTPSLQEPPPNFEPVAPRSLRTSTWGPIVAAS